MLLGNGDGTFSAAVNYNTGATPVSVAVGDFNGDRQSDLVAANNGSNNVSMLLGNGDGTFQASQNTTTNLNTNPVALAVGDLVGSGSDLVAADTTNSVSVLLSNGSSLLPSALYGTGSTTSPAAVR